MSKRFAEVPLLYMERTEPAFAIGSGRVFGPFYTADWEYLNLFLQASAAVAGPLFVSVSWWLNETPSSGEAVTDELTVWVRNPEGGYGEWCIPVRGVYCQILVSSPAGVPAYRMQARLSHVYSPHPGNTMISRTTVGSSGVITDAYASYSTIGHAKLQGYCFNSGVGTFAIVAVQELQSVTGVWETIYYQQTPAGAVANFVQVFELDIPLSGRHIRVRENTGGGGANNSLVWIQPYAHFGA